MVDTLIVVDARGIIRLVNDVTCRISGYAKSALIGKPVGMLFVAQKNMPFMDYWTKKLGTEPLGGSGAQDVGMTLRTRAGVEVPMFFSGSAMKNRRGEVLGSVFVARDARETRRLMQISTEAILASKHKALELKKRAQELMDQKFYIEEIVSSIPTALLVLDNDLRVLSANLRYGEIFGSAGTVVTGRPVAECLGEISDEVRADLQGRLDRLRSAGEPLRNFEFRFILPAGEPKIVSLTAAVVRLTSDVRVLILIDDISESKRLMEHLIRSEKLEATSHLAAGLAHEIKNPLAIILGHIELIAKNAQLKDHMDGGVRHSIQVIEKMVDRSTRLIRGLMDFARAGDMQVKPLNVHEFLEHLLGIVFPKASAQRIRVHHRFARRHSIVIRADEALMTQLFTNLIFNAIESMQAGGVLTVETGISDRAGMADIRVADTGCGIPADKLGMVFQPFFSTKPSGTGMGLPVCYGIVEKHGGHIDIKSEAGKGTTVTVWLPLSS